MLDLLDRSDWHDAHHARWWSFDLQLHLFLQAHGRERYHARRPTSLIQKGFLWFLESPPYHYCNEVFKDERDMISWMGWQDFHFSSEHADLFRCQWNHCSHRTPVIRSFNLGLVQLIKIPGLIARNMLRRRPKGQNHLFRLRSSKHDSVMLSKEGTYYPSFVEPKFQSCSLNTVGLNTGSDITTAREDVKQYVAPEI